MLWDNLPDDIQDIIYKKIMYTQPKNLQNDLITYINTIEQIEYRNSITMDYTDWDILWCLVLLYYKKDNKEKENHFNYMKDFVLNNNNIMIRYDGAMYWIKKYVKKISMKDRKYFIYTMNKT
tara:strand:+ start:400 stop:765 length:366 start_codon:yes stop_codon:yes gene_type:complete